MKKNLVAVLAVLISAPVRSQTVQTPASVSLRLNDEAAEAAFRPTFSLGSSWKLTPVLRGGLLAPFDSLPVPFSVLRTSPYAVAGVDAQYSGALESLVMATFGYTNLRSQKGISDPGGNAASPASSLPSQTQFSQDLASGSFYGDLGKVVGISPKVKAAFFAAADAVGMTSIRAGSSMGGTGLVEANTGALVMYKDKANEASVFGDVRMEGAMKTMYRNYDFTAVPAGTIGAEYARTQDGHRVAGGVETTVQRGDIGVRPYVDWSHGPVSAEVAGNFRKSQNNFYPDVVGGAAEVRLAAVPGVQFGVMGDFSHETYSMAPAAVNTYGMMGTFTVNYEKLFQGDVARRVQERKEGRQYQAQDSYDMNARLPGGTYGFDFAAALRNSPTFPEFVKNIHAKTTDDILSSVSAFTSSFGGNNYNYNEPKVLNVDNVGEIYQRGRTSYLNGTNDPILVCIGSSQFAAVLAEAMGKQAGIPIEAMATIVAVPDKNGQQDGHAVAVIKTKEYGIVIVDWGKLTPTYTWDTNQAMRIYQALVGIPTLFHTVTAGTDGHHIGYLFTDEGKAMVRNLSFNAEAGQPVLGRLFNDAPRGDALTIERFKELTRNKF